jgi:hypothetical protein
MKQYRITSEHFVTPGETGDADAYMAPDELAQLKKLAGVGFGQGLLEEYQPGMSDPGVNTPNDCDQDMSSPMGGKDSMPSSEKRQIEKQKGIKVGTPEWFQLWFSKPFLTGEKPVGDAVASKTPRDKSDN